MQPRAEAGAVETMRTSAVLRQATSVFMTDRRCWIYLIVCDNPRSVLSFRCLEYRRNADRPCRRVGRWIFGDAERGARSGRADAGDELLDLGGEIVRLALELAGRAQHRACGCAGLAGDFRHLADVLGDFAGALGGFLNVAGDVARGGRLFLHGGCDRARGLVDLPDDLTDALNRRYRLVGRLLHGAYLRDDLVGRPFGRGREALDLGGNHRETPSGFAGPRGLDGGIERQQFGLRRDVVDHSHHIADLLRRTLQAAYFVVRALGFAYRKPRHVARLGDLGGDLLQGCGHLVGGRGDRLDVAGGLLRRNGGSHRLTLGLVGDFGHAVGGVVERGDRGRDRAEVQLHIRFEIDHQTTDLGGALRLGFLRGRLLAVEPIAL